MRAPSPLLRRRAGPALVAIALLGLCGSALAQGNPGLPLVVGQGAGGTSYSVPIQTLLFFTALSFLPAVVLMMTGFTRIVIVLSLLRQALGTQAAPPNQVIIGLSLFLTFFVMSPTLDQVYDKAYQPFAANQIVIGLSLFLTFFVMSPVWQQINSEALQPYKAQSISQEQALAKGLAPIRKFMLSQTREKDLSLFLSLSKLPRPKNASSLCNIPIKSDSSSTNSHGKKFWNGLPSKRIYPW
jgi:flagellar biosynthetic protein FliP